MRKRKVPPAGELRQSQLITTFGPGAMVDLPDHSVLIGGLDTWTGQREQIHEERLEAWLQNHLKAPDLRLFAPPIDADEPGGRQTGVAAYQFPLWFLGQVDKTWTDPEGRVYRTRPLIPHTSLVKGGYSDEDRKIKPVVPVRFVQACEHGHLSDINWHAFVRDDFKAERSGALWFDEGGAGNDFAEIFVRDVKTGMRRPLSDATIPGSAMLGTCRGQRPWLGEQSCEKCGKSNRLLTRAASNAYFAQTVRVISIPDGQQALKDAVSEVWEFLQICDDKPKLQFMRQMERVQSALEGFDDATVWAEIQRRHQGLEPPDKSIKQVEIETLLSQKPTLGEDKPEGNFYARTHELGPLPLVAQGKVDKLVLVHRLREVVAQIGFTRFEPTFTDVDGELDLDIALAPLSRELEWLPATENRGEGLFISFAPAAIEAWLERPGVKERAQQLIQGHKQWQQGQDRQHDFAGLPYIMLHSLSHLLITALSLDCGYSASAISERVYAGESGYGILLYTGSSGSEGTLGGLVDMGKNIGRHLERALELGRLCSNDPVCSQHEPSDTLRQRYHHGAACHGCLLIAETSCERRNELLDRALVVPTVGAADAAFFVS